MYKPTALGGICDSQKEVRLMNVVQKTNLSPDVQCILPLITWQTTVSAVKLGLQANKGATSF